MKRKSVTLTPTAPAFPTLLALALLAPACGLPDGGSPGPAPPIPALSAAEIEESRVRKDERYRTDPDSPIPPGKRAEFEGLSYFPVDLDARHVVRLVRYEDPPPLRVVTTNGEVRPAVKIGFVEFERKGAVHRLQVYQLRDMSAENWGEFFLPFMDGTTGEETYPAGRYIELAEGPDDWYLLDFNLAYFPLCAYGRTDYQCPRTPEENRLPTSVRAGERLPAAEGLRGAAVETDGAGA
jgi:uncharacterized protein (DUF1684 family)